MSDAERRVYQRGYNRAAHWPDHLPPEPPNEFVAELMRAATMLRNACDAQIAQGSEQEDSLGPGIDAVDAAMERIGQWLRKASP